MFISQSFLFIGFGPPAITYNNIISGCPVSEERPEPATAGPQLGQLAGAVLEPAAAAGPANATAIAAAIAIAI